ncbi:DMT family transporter [Tistrella mobilis]|uniref:DMT family transporter n=1 Tax=Tistrella mobilis TaxID=171437 RepID=UPI0002E7817C|nr:EamA family transporter [Tistrella mobilis]
MNNASRDQGLGSLAVLFAALVWGTTGTAATFAPEVGAAAIGAAAMGLGGLLQALRAGRGILRARHDLARNRVLLILGGVAVAVYPLAFYASMRLAGVTIGTVVTIGSAPLLSALIERIFDRTRLSPRWLAGALTGVAGILLLCLAEGGAGVGVTEVGASDTGDAVLAGIGLGLVGGFTYALYSWTARGLMLRGIRSSVAMGATFGIGGLLLMPVLALTGAPFLTSWGNAAVGIYMALVPMFLGYVCFGLGLARIPASLATTISLIEPVVAAILAILVVGERLPPAGWAGVALVIACLAIVTLPARRRPFRPAPPAATSSGPELP